MPIGSESLGILSALICNLLTSFYKPIIPSNIVRHINAGKITLLSCKISTIHKICSRLHYLHKKTHEIPSLEFHVLLYLISSQLSSRILQEFRNIDLYLFHCAFWLSRSLNPHCRWCESLSHRLCLRNRSDSIM